MGYISDIRKKIGHSAIFMPASGCVIIKEGKVLLQRRTDNNKWSSHGGCLELGESFLDALKREVKEELNIEVKDPEFVNIHSGEKMHFFYPNKDEVYVLEAIYLVTEYEGELKPDNKEVSELKWFDIDDLPNDINGTEQQPINDIILYYKNKYCK